MKKLRKMYYFAILLIKYMNKSWMMYTYYTNYILETFFEVLVYIFSPPFNSEVKIKQKKFKNYMVYTEYVY